MTSVKVEFLTNFTYFGQFRKKIIKLIRRLYTSTLMLSRTITKIYSVFFNRSRPCTEAGQAGDKSKEIFKKDVTPFQY